MKMSIPEKLLVQIFDGKNAMINEVKQMAYEFRRNNVLKCIIDARSRNPTEPKNEELIEKLLFSYPPPSFPYSTSHNSLNNKKAITVNRSDNLFNESHASNKELNDPTILPQCLGNNAGCSLKSNPELESNAPSPEERTDARILDSHHEACLPHSSFQRSKSRQKDLELRNSVEAQPKSCSHDVNNTAASSSEGAGCMIASLQSTHVNELEPIKHLTNGFREEKVDRCKGKERGSSNYSGRITRSRSSCQQSNHVYQSSNLNSTSYVGNEDGDTSVSIGKQVQKHNHVKESLELVNSSSTTNESCRVNKEVIGDKCTKENGSSDHCGRITRFSQSGRITRSRSVSQQSNHVYLSSNPKRSSYDNNEEGDRFVSIGEPVQQHNHVKESIELANPSDTTYESCRVNKEVIGDKCTKENGSSGHCGRITRLSQSGRITRSRSVCQQSNHVYLSSNPKRSSYVSNEEGDRFVSTGEPVQHHNHVKESIELTNPSDTTNESCIVNKEVIGDKCKKEHGSSDHYCGRITRSRLPCQRLISLNMFPKLDNSSDILNIDGDTLQRAEVSAEEVDDMQPSQGLIQFGGETDLRTVKGTQMSTARSLPGQMDLKLYAVNTRKHQSMGNDADKYVGRWTRSQHSCTIQGMSEHVNSNISDHRQTRFRNAASNRFQNGQGDQMSAGMPPPSQNDLESCSMNTGEYPSMGNAADECTCRNPRSQAGDGIEGKPLPINSNISDQRQSRNAASLGRFEVDDLHYASGIDVNVLPSTDIADLLNCERSGATLKETEIVSKSAVEASAVPSSSDWNGASHRVGLEVLVSRPPSDSLMLVKPKPLDFDDMDEYSLKAPYSPSLEAKRGETSLEKGPSTLLEPLSPMEEFSQPGRCVSLTLEGSWPQNKQRMMEHQPTNVFSDPPSLTVNPFQSIARDDIPRCLNEEDDSSQAFSSSLHVVEVAQSNNKNPDQKSRQIVNSHILEGSENSSELRVEEGKLSLERRDESAITSFIFEQQQLGPSLISSLTQQENASYQGCLLEKSPALVCEAEKSLDRGRLDSVNTETSYTRTHNIVKPHKRRCTSKEKENLKFSLGANGVEKVSDAFHNRFTKPKSSEKSGLRKGSASISERESKCKMRNNIVSNMTSFVPLVQQKQSAAVITGNKRDIKVKALEAAEAAKRLEEKKEHERKKKKESHKIERARLEQENLRQLELKKKQKEEEQKKKDADTALRKRLREGEEKKDREVKRKRIEEAWRKRREHEDKLCAGKQAKVPKCRPVDESVRETKESLDDKGRHKKLKQEKRGDNHGKNPETESRINPISMSDIHKTSIVVKEFEAFDDHDGIGMVIRNMDKTPENGNLVTKESREKSYEISPYQGDEDEDEEEDGIPNNKFIPSWASKNSISPIISSQQQIHSNVIFPPESFCSIAEGNLSETLHALSNCHHV